MLCGGPAGQVWQHIRWVYGSISGGYMAAYQVGMGQHIRWVWGSISGGYGAAYQVGMGAAYQVGMGQHIRSDVYCMLFISVTHTYAHL